MSPASGPITIYIDADACLLKQEIYRVAERHALKGIALKVFIVTNSPIAVPRDPLIERGSSAPAWTRWTIGSRSAPALSWSRRMCRWRAGP
jgi:hypothetical protein